MGIFITFLVFGFPILFLFWACCSMTVGGSFLGGFVLMMLMIIVPIVIAINKEGNDPKLLQKIEEKNNKFMEEVKKTTGRCFSLCGGQEYLLFDSRGGYSGYLIKHYIKSGENSKYISFESIKKCEITSRKGIVRSCSVNGVSIINPNSETKGFRLEIDAGERKIEIKSDDLYLLEQIFDTTEYVITKGKSMEKSPFSK